MIRSFFISSLGKSSRPGGFFLCPEGRSRPFRLITQWRDRPKRSRKCAVPELPQAVRIRSALDSSGSIVLDTLIIKSWYLGMRGKQHCPRAVYRRGRLRNGWKRERPRSCNTWSENTSENQGKPSEYKPLKAFLFCSETAISEQNVTN